jgi:hypothetical protein
MLCYSILMPYKNKEDLYKNQQKYRDRNHDKMWEYLSNKKCVDCGTDDLRVLEFDHLPEHKKEFDIAKSISGSTRSWDKILNEIKKCDVVCSNCHKIRTMTRGNYKRYKSYIIKD